MSRAEAVAVPLPAESRIGTIYPHTDLADAWAIDVPPGSARDPELLARFIFAHPPAWVTRLMGLRDTLVSPFRLKTGRGIRSADVLRQRVGIFRLYGSDRIEALMGEDDKHLDFRASVLFRDPAGNGPDASIVLSTVVHCHNGFGRAYIALVAPFHRAVVKALLRQSAKAGWPRDEQDRAR